MTTGEWVRYYVGCFVIGVASMALANNLTVAFMIDLPLILVWWYIHFGKKS